ncbi:hypothetical protein TIFTF001_042099 [Ficus carica]|uniref:Transmembrane protein n=1 Tax=Ficus carica TaxID=3494 RepID=A0AA87ZIP4_FICCA|nr:hypothetical protein TIFTF001_042091 [Ficus carica]GMN34611.1 hypothetical protein TIFTF001_042093 [Ficus carica]GMN34622.1 hypothetical protein TIFTF001_042097 [Ficus carica]GMN34637.1 hypothetical protein TIFTF001_042099 [Ficus carica]
MVSDNMLVPSEGWVGAVLEPSVESWLPFVVLKSGSVRCEGSWIPRELGCGAVVRDWVNAWACVARRGWFVSLMRSQFFLLVAGLLSVMVRSRRWTEVSLLVPCVGFCVDLGFVNRVLVVVWLGVVWWAIASAFPE